MLRTKEGILSPIKESAIVGREGILSLYQALFQDKRHCLTGSASTKERHSSAGV